MNPNWPSPAEFTTILFLALFFSWTKLVLCTATALIVRSRLLGIAIAFAIGFVETALDRPADLWLVQFLDFYNYVTFALSGLAGVLWWCIGRGGRALIMLGLGPREQEQNHPDRGPDGKR